MAGGAGRDCAAGHAASAGTPRNRTISAVVVTGPEVREMTVTEL